VARNKRKENKNNEKKVPGKPDLKTKRPKDLKKRRN